MLIECVCYLDNIFGIMYCVSVKEWCDNFF